MYHIRARRREANSIIRCSGPDDDHYVRLFMLSGIDLLITIPFNTWYFVTWFPVMPWPGWKASHSDWAEIPIITAAQWGRTTSGMVYYEITRWIVVVYGVVFFVFFGLNVGARRNYASTWQHVSKMLYLRMGFPPELSRYVLDPDSISPQPFFRELVMNSPPRGSVCSPTGNLGDINFARNQPDKSDYSGSSCASSRSIITLPTTSVLGSKPEAESEFVPSEDLAKPSPALRQCPPQADSRSNRPMNMLAFTKA
jgi:Pheromone A receptor